MKKKYVVKLTDAEQQELVDIVNTGKKEASKIRNAHILLKSDVNGPGWTDVKIADAYAVTDRTVAKVRKRFVEGGFSRALYRVKRKHPPTPCKLDGEAEAKLIALSCSEPPEGVAKWTLRLLASELVRLEVVESISPETVRQTLKKNALKPHLQAQWVIPPEKDAEFVKAMEKVLDLYQKSLDKDNPVVNMDEQSITLRGDVRDPHLMKPGQVKRVDNEYKRNGTANVFLFTEALSGWRRVSVRKRRQAVDWAEEVKILLDEDYPSAERVILV